MVNGAKDAPSLRPAVREGPRLDTAAFTAKEAIQPQLGESEKCEAATLPKVLSFNLRQEGAYEAVKAALREMRDYQPPSEVRGKAYTLEGALEWLDRVSPENDAAYFTIYGDGGIRRYFVRASGCVEISSRHGIWDKAILETAAKLGFAIN